MRCVGKNQPIFIVEINIFTARLPIVLNYTLILYMESEAVRIEREAKEAAIRKAEEEKRQKELRRQRYNDEIDRLNALKQEAVDFETACRIRAYVAAIEEKSDISDEQKEWINWAKAKADWYDPTKDATDPILGKKDHNSNKGPEKIGPSWW